MSANHPSPNVRRRIAIGVIALAAGAGIGIGVPSIAHAQGGTVVVDARNNGDGTTTVVRTVTDSAGNVIEQTCRVLVNPA